MSQNQSSSRFDRVVMVALPPKVEQRITAAVRKALGKVEVVKIDESDLSNGLPDLQHSLLVMAHGVGDLNAVEALKGLRQRGVEAGVLLLANGRATGLEEEIADLGPVTTLSVSGFRRAARRQISG